MPVTPLNTNITTSVVDTLVIINIINIVAIIIITVAIATIIVATIANIIDLSNIIDIALLYKRNMQLKASHKLFDLKIIHDYFCQRSNDKILQDQLYFCAYAFVTLSIGIEPRPQSL